MATDLMTVRVGLGLRGKVVMFVGLRLVMDTVRRAQLGDGYSS